MERRNSGRPSTVSLCSNLIRLAGSSTTRRSTAGLPIRVRRSQPLSSSAVLFAEITARSRGARLPSAWRGSRFPRHADGRELARVSDELALAHHVDPLQLSLIHISEPTRLGMISYAVFCLK